MSSEQEARVDSSVIINSALSSIVYQLKSAEETATGTAKSIIGSLLNENGLVSVHFNAIREAFDFEISEFNGAIDMLEARDAEISELKTKLNKLASELESSKLDQGEAEVKAIELETGIKLAYSRIKQGEQEFKELSAVLGEARREVKQAREQSGRIEWLKKKARELTIELEDLRKVSREQRAEIIKHRKEKARIASDLADAGNKNNYMQDKVKELAERLTYNDGDVSDQVFESEQGVKFYLYSFGFGLKCYDADRKLIMPAFHFELRTNLGFCVLVMVDEFLSPVIPRSKDMGVPPQGVIDLLKEQILKRCKPEFPELYERRQWAESTSVDTLGLSNQSTKNLKNAGIESVLDVVTHPIPKMVKLPKIGAATAQSAHDLARTAIRVWEKEQEAEKRFASK